MKIGIFVVMEMGMENGKTPPITVVTIMKCTVFHFFATPSNFSEFLPKLAQMITGLSHT